MTSFTREIGDLMETERLLGGLITCLLLIASGLFQSVGRDIWTGIKSKIRSKHYVDM